MLCGWGEKKHKDAMNRTCGGRRSLWDEGKPLRSGKFLHYDIREKLILKIGFSLPKIQTVELVWSRAKNE